MPDSAYFGSGNFVETATKDSAILPPFPTGWGAGQTAILHIVCSAFGTGSVTPTIVPPASGWRQLGTELYASGFANTRAPRMQLWMRVLQAGDTAPSLSMTGGTNNGTSARIGAKISTWTDAGVIRMSAGAVGDASTLTAPGVTTKDPTPLIIAFTGIGDANTLSGQAWTNPAAPTERYDEVVSTRLQLGLTTGYQSSPGATGSFTATPSGTTDPWCAITLSMEDVETFPTQSVLDNFNRGDGALGADWTDDTFNFSNAGLTILSNQANNDTAFDERSYYSGAAGQGDGQIAVTVATLPATSERVMLGYRVVDPDLATVDGYELIYERKSGVDDFILYRVDNKTYTSILDVDQDVIAGDKIGVAFTGGTHEVFVIPSSGPKINVGRITDSTYTAAGYLALGIKGSSARVDDFIAGPLVTGVIGGSSAVNANITADLAISEWVNLAFEATITAIASVGGTNILDAPAGLVTFDGPDVSFTGSNVADAGLSTFDAAAPGMRQVYNLSAGDVTFDGPAPVLVGVFSAPVGRNLHDGQIRAGAGDLVRGREGTAGTVTE